MFSMVKRLQTHGRDAEQHRASVSPFRKADTSYMRIPPITFFRFVLKTQCLYRPFPLKCSTTTISTFCFKNFISSRIQTSFQDINFFYLDTNWDCSKTHRCIYQHNPKLKEWGVLSKEQVHINRLAHLLSCNILQLQSRMYDELLSVATETSNL